MLPEPAALSVIAVPLKLAPRLIEPLLAVVLRDNIPDELSATETFKLLLSDIVKALKVLADVIELSTPVLVIVAVPLVFNVKAPVAVFMLPIFPDVEFSETLVVPVTTLEV